MPWSLEGSKLTKICDFGEIWLPLATAFTDILPHSFWPSEAYSASTLSSNFKAISTKMRPPEGGKVETLAPPSDKVYEYFSLNFKSPRGILEGCRQ